MGDKKGKQSHQIRILWILLGLSSFIIIGGIALFLSHDKRPTDRLNKKDRLKIDEPVKEPIKEITSPPSSYSKAHVAIIIDDIGWNLNTANLILNINAPITLSILPNLEYSRKIAELAADQGREVLLHIPMEAYGRHKKLKSARALTVGMDPAVMRGLTEKYIDSIPYISGVNNHQGSRFTEDKVGMSVFLNVLKEKNLFFVDSRTNPKTVGFKLAKEIGLPAAQRHVFLDNEDNRYSINERIAELSQIALRRGFAIGIGHPHPNTINALKDMISSFVDKDIIIVPVSELVK